jgi:RTX calcium-binding nonapeptide repeat (4 copies)
MLRSLAGAVAALAIAAPAASAHGGSPPDAQIFSTNNTRVITDPSDPQLSDPLKEFAREVERIVGSGGGSPRGSQLLDGVFFSSDLGTTTFERSREFDVDHVSDDELHAIADDIRGRFQQESVLTFDNLRAGDDEINAVELEVPGVSAAALRDGLLADQTAREELFGGSVTLDGHLLLVASLDDEQLARTFAGQIGGDLSRAQARYGESEFVEGPAPVRIEHRTLVVSGTPEADAATVHERYGRVAVDLGGQQFEFARKRFDRIHVDLGDGLDTLAVDGDEHLRATASGQRARLIGGQEPIELDNVDQLRLSGAPDVTVDDLSATAVFQVDVELGPGVDRATVNASNEDEQISVSKFTSGVSVLGPTFVRFENAEPTDRLTVDGRGGDDIISASTDAMKLTLEGGDGTNVLLGGPGDDTLIGGDGFDDAKGGKGDDVVRLGAYFDRFSWAPGDGNDSVDGGASHDSLFVQGTNDPEVFGVNAERKHVRFTRDVDGVALDLSGIEEIDPVAGGGADTFDIGDLSGTGVDLVDVSLGSGGPGGDGQPDKVSVAGTDRADHLAVTGKVVVAGTATLTGLPAKVNISHAEGANDTLAIDTRGGNDTVDSSGLAPGTIKLDVK